MRTALKHIIRRPSFSPLVAKHVLHLAVDRITVFLIDVPAGSLGNCRVRCFGCCDCKGAWNTSPNSIFSKVKKRKRRKVAKHSTLVLLAGLAIELLALVRTSQLSGMMIAKLNDEAGQARKTAEAEHLERVKLEQRVADRHVTVEQRGKMLKILRSRRGTTVIIEPIISEARDTFPYAREIAEVFHDAKDAQWDAENPWRLITMDAPLHGFLIEIQHDSAANTQLANVTREALRVLDPRVTQKRVSGDRNSARDIIVLVGGK